MHRGLWPRYPRGSRLRASVSTLIAISPPPRTGVSFRGLLRCARAGRHHTIPCGREPSPPPAGCRERWGCIGRPKSNIEPRMGLSGTLMMGLPVVSMSSAMSLMKFGLPGAQTGEFAVGGVSASRQAPLVGTPRHERTMMASTPSHSATSLSTRGPTSPPADATMSRGLCLLQNGGRISSSAA